MQEAAGTSEDTNGKERGTPETPAQLRQRNAIGELRAALDDLERASARVARILRGIHPEDRALLAEPTAIRAVHQISKIVEITQEAA